MERKLLTLGCFAIMLFGCRSSTSQKPQLIQDVSGIYEVVPDQIWLSHEHILVDFDMEKYVNEKLQLQTT